MTFTSSLSDLFWPQNQWISISANSFIFTHPKIEKKKRFSISLFSIHHQPKSFHLYRSWTVVQVNRRLIQRWRKLSVVFPRRLLLSHRLRCPGLRIFRRLLAMVVGLFSITYLETSLRSPLSISLRSCLLARVLMASFGNFSPILVSIFFCLAFAFNWIKEMILLIGFGKVGYFWSEICKIDSFVSFWALIWLGFGIYTIVSMKALSFWGLFDFAVRLWTLKQMRALLLRKSLTLLTIRLMQRGLSVRLSYFVIWIMKMSVFALSFLTKNHLCIALCRA